MDQRPCLARTDPNDLAAGIELPNDLGKYSMKIIIGLVLVVVESEWSGIYNIWNY